MFVISSARIVQPLLRWVFFMLIIHSNKRIMVKSNSNYNSKLDEVVACVIQQPCMSMQA